MTNQNLFLEIEKHLLEDVKPSIFLNKIKEEESFKNCLLYTSDAADERSSVDLGGRRIIKKKKTRSTRDERMSKRRKN